MSIGIALPLIQRRQKIAERLMPHGVRLKVSGERACFTRPEMKVERVSYDVMTPSAARGILEAIHWKPAIVWTIDRIHVLKPIRFSIIPSQRSGRQDQRRQSKGCNALGLNGQ